VQRVGESVAEDAALHAASAQAARMEEVEGMAAS
jgi:hypothetical protein